MTGRGCRGERAAAIAATPSRLRRSAPRRRPRIPERVPSPAPFSSHPTAPVATFLRDPHPPPTLTRGGPRNGSGHRNPLVGAQRARKRNELLAATEIDLAAIAHRVTAGTLTGADLIGLATGPALKRYRMRKHFQTTITDTTFTYTRKTAEIAAEAALDGFYILRTGLTETDLQTGDVVRAYKNLEQAERAFGSIKGPDLQIRPIHHHLEDRVRAHVLICMLAYYLTWHLKAAWKPLLFTDEHRPVSPDPVAKAERSPAARHKAQTKRTSTGQSAHSYRTLLTELATQTQNTTRLHDHASTFEKLTQPTALQAEALDLAAHAPVVVDR